MPERRGDRALGPRLDVEEGERESLTLLRQCPRRRRQAFPLGQRPLERLEPLMCDARLFAQRLALDAHACVEHAAWPRELGAKIVELRLRALAAKLQALARAAQPVEHRRRLFAPAGGVGELFLRAAAVLEQAVELVVRMLACEHGCRAPVIAVLEPLAQLGQI